ncbi:MAG: hypothetical protein EBR02_01510 [Alphaproteobacteria bacterium]|nr:hypothetical protein [Alphaproteobacteria bacterium]
MTISYHELKDIICAVPTFATISANAHKDTGTEHAADAQSFLALDMRYSGNQKSAELSAIDGFLDAEKYTLTASYITEPVKRSIRRLCDEVRAELRRRGEEIPDRDESNWVVRPSQYRSQRSFDPNGGGYTRGGG